MDVGKMLRIAEITMKDLVEKTELDSGWEKRWVNVETYLSQILMGKESEEKCLPGTEGTL
jgi:hypothetical protein